MSDMCEQDGGGGALCMFIGCSVTVMMMYRPVIPELLSPTQRATQNPE